jgi:hypothetical protein
VERGNGITIVHLDTGYDPTHRTVPPNLDHARQRNFVEAAHAGDATDRTPERALLTQRGHGTGTLGILAGGPLAGLRAAEPVPAQGFLGGAPGASIVPVRIADSVVHFWTSAVAQGIAYAREIGADIVSMSMGGLPSAAWADAVNAAYEAGIVVVCAAGNNFGGAPTSLVVYPARFGRVIAACGVMADGSPYFGLPVTAMQGNVGPASKMATTLAAYTPNIPWARIGAPEVVDLNGGGTSAATPQVAAAAALWLARFQPRYRERWMRVEAVRNALFGAAARGGSAPDPLLGRGILRAGASLAIPPAAAEELRAMPRDRADLAFLRLLTGAFGMGPADRRAPLLGQEIAQIALRSRAAQQAVPDPDLPPEQIPEAQRRRFLEAILGEADISAVLRRHIETGLGHAAPAGRPRIPDLPGAVAAAAPPRPATGGDLARRMAPQPPGKRRLRVFALDPGAANRLATAFINTTTIEVPWETADGSPNTLQPGPVGEYVEVVDIDPASGAAYDPVDLNDPFLLAQDGLPPSEGNPQFHQQMVYAVAMRTIRNFEIALGRRAHWAPRRQKREALVRRGERQGGGTAASGGTRPGSTGLASTSGGRAGDRYETYVGRLRIYPHALRQENAYYSPDKAALLFGYFPSRSRAGGQGLVFTCLSHDIIAHETTHALLDGLHRRYQEATNPDVLAFHEAFADIVAIFQHFTFSDLLRFEIGRVGGDLRQGRLLGDLARQFGDALGRSRALRSAIGDDMLVLSADGGPKGAHDRGAVLVAAVFDAFLAIYARRTEDLRRLASSGTGLLQSGAALHPDLVERLAREATRVAQHVLTICIRALDYMPPVDPTFANYLRALITADSDLVPDDRHGYRVAFLEAFEKRGIHPDDVRTFSVESLRWKAPATQPKELGEFIRRLEISWDIYGDRFDAWREARRNAYRLHEWLREKFDPDQAQQLGLDFRPPPADGQADPFEGRRDDNGLPRFEVHSVRPARRSTPEGAVRTDLIAVITQRRWVAGSMPGGGFWFRGGCTLVLDRGNRAAPVRYCITKPVWNTERAAREASFAAAAEPHLHEMYFGAAGEAEPFAFLHVGH